MDYFNFNQTPLSPLILSPLPYSSTLVTPTTGLGSTIKGALDPTVGGTTDTYHFAVIYTPSQSPSTHNVIIDGTTYPMDPVKQLPNGAGTQYEYSTQLGVGTHSYKFVFSDPTTSSMVTLPDNGVTYTGPEVHPFSLANVGGNVSPAQTVPGQPVKYQVTYTSPAGLAPTVAQVLIDGYPFNMQATGSNYQQGVKYTFTYTFSTANCPLSIEASTQCMGLHQVQYHFDDGSGPMTTLGLITPLITPMLLTHATYSQDGQGNVTFNVNYQTVDSETPNATLYVDNTPYAMTQSVNNTSQYTATVPLAAGSHSLFYIFTDSQSSWDLPIAPDAIHFTATNVNAKSQGSLVVPAFDFGDLLSDPNDPDDIG